MLIIFVIFFVLPIYVAYQAYLYGYKGYALATFIATFLGFGWLIGIFAYVQIKNAKTTKMLTESDTLTNNTSPRSNTTKIMNDSNTMTNYTPPKSYSVNGIGTMFFGASDRQPDGSFVTTQWFAFAGFPLFPLRSDRVKYLGEKTCYLTTTNTYYDIIGSAPLDKNQIIQIYGVILLILLVSAFYLPALFVLAVLWIMFVLRIIYKAK